MSVGITELLEWAAFLSSALCVFLYGHSKLRGALAGLATAILFVSWGLLAPSVPAALIKTGFFGLHARNLFIALKERQLNAYLEETHRDQR